MKPALFAARADPFVETERTCDESSCDPRATSAGSGGGPSRHRGWVEAQNLTTQDEVRLPSQPAAVQEIGEPQDAKFFQLLGMYLSETNHNAGAVQLDGTPVEKRAAHGSEDPGWSAGSPGGWTTRCPWRPSKFGEPNSPTKRMWFGSEN